jgi:L-threonylcarbamoyladenylate synthase
MPMRSPGLLHKHYSPRAPLTLYEGPDALHALMQDTRSAVNAGLKVGVIAADEDRAALHATQYGDRSHVISLGSLHDLSTVAANLYAALRAIDAAGVDGILVRGFPSEEGLGVAIQDRLRRAAAGRIVTSGGPGAG